MDYRHFDENFGLENKVAIIAGASSGIGLEIAKMFARKGAKIVAFDRNESDDLKQYMAGITAAYLFFQGDITNNDSLENLVAQCVQTFGRIDILVNSAGIGGTAKAEEHSEELWDNILKINLKGTVRMTQVVGKIMIEQNSGKIINLASQAGVVALEKHLGYGASKAGVIYITKQFALEWAQYNINVNAISPTVILTPMGEKHWNTPEGEEFRKHIPARRFGYPEEVAAMAVYLASDASALVNGANLVIDGGYTIG